MRRRRVGSSWFLLPSRAFVMYQPLGVVGVIGAWNYQLLLTLSPVVDALAAGNHVMLKPSEITPRTASVISELIAEAFPAEYVTVVTGGRRWPTPSRGSRSITSCSPGRRAWGSS